MDSTDPAQHTPIAPEHGRVDASSPGALKEAAGAAYRAGDVARATHLYTLALDLVPGVVGGAVDASKDWLALEKASGGILHALLSNRALCHLKVNDFAASASDAGLI